jgi:DNA-binding protein HU-beta
MNKTDLVSQVAQTSELTQKDAAKAVDAVFNTVLEALKNGIKFN